MDVGAELGQPTLVGKVQLLGCAVHLRIFLVRVYYRWLVFSDYHLHPPKVCHARYGSRMLAGGYSPLASVKRPDTPTSMNRKQAKFGESAFHATRVHSPSSDAPGLVGWHHTCKA